MSSNPSSLTYYDVLGIPANASEVDIKRAYRTLAMEMHPDVGGSAHGMRILNRAYKTLKDVDLRAEYDATLFEAAQEHRQPESKQPSPEELILQEKTMVSGVRKAAGKTIFIGVGIFLAGFIITGITYSAASPGGHYAVFWGAIVWGGIVAIRGWYSWLNPYAILRKSLDNNGYRHTFYLEKKGLAARAIGIIIISCVGIFIILAGLSSGSSTGQTTTAAPSTTVDESTGLKAEYDSCIDEYDTLKARLSSVNETMNSYRSSGDTDTYNAYVPTQNDLVRQSQDKYNECEIKRTDYNASLST